VEGARPINERKPKKNSYLPTTPLYAACMAWGGKLYRFSVTTPFTNHAEQVHFHSKVQLNYMKIHI